MKKVIILNCSKKQFTTCKKKSFNENFTTVEVCMEIEKSHIRVRLFHGNDISKQIEINTKCIKIKSTKLFV